MKAGREHRVPLSERAVEILTGLAETKIGDFVFPGAKRGSRLCVMALTMVMRRTGVGDFTVHGFRSAFRDWAVNADRNPHFFGGHESARPQLPPSL
jgi:integrase